MSLAPEVPVRPGDILAGKYRVERILGHGGMGVVVAATQLDLGRLVALKFLLHAVHQIDIVARFLREGRIVGGLHSEHVTRVYELGQLENGVHYMAMEYLDGADLAALLAQRGPFHFTEAAAVVRQACEAIAEAHQSGVVHRDLKPANLFSTRRPNGAHLIKVLDFGISKMSTANAADHSMTRTSALMGSPYYMSPEQMARPKTVDFRTDIWSLGVILHELVTGKVPFQGETLAELALNVHHEQPPPIASLRSGVPAAYQAIVTRCLQKDRELRFGSIRELSAALEACEGLLAPYAPAPVATDAGKTGNWGGTIARSRRPRVLAATIGSLLGVLALGTTAALLWPRTRNTTPADLDAHVTDSRASAAMPVVSSLPASATPSEPTLSATPDPGSPVVSLVPTASAAASSSTVPSVAASALRPLPSPRRVHAASPPTPANAPSKHHPAGWDDEILKP
jgi:serine/threonine-protein kinase